MADEMTIAELAFRGLCALGFLSTGANSFFVKRVIAKVDENEKRISLHELNDANTFAKTSETNQHYTDILRKIDTNSQEIRQEISNIRTELNSGLSEVRGTVNSMRNGSK